VGQKKVLLSGNPKDTDPYSLGTTDHNLNKALQLYKSKVEKTHRKNLEDL
jgi:hypothetical protein